MSCYRKITNRRIYLIDSDYLNNNPDVLEENVALLKNAIELWKSAVQSTDAVAPILFHYSWHCFNAFFAYTFFRWEPKHSDSHGVKAWNFNDDVEKIQISLSRRESGLFKRVVDTWTCLGTSPAFSAYLPMFEGKEIGFQPNQSYFFRNSNCLDLGNLIQFDPIGDFQRKYWHNFGREKL